jgi:hypothetical protein
MSEPEASELEKSESSPQEDKPTVAKPEEQAVEKTLAKTMIFVDLEDEELAPVNGDESAGKEIASGSMSQQARPR